MPTDQAAEPGSCPFRGGRVCVLAGTVEGGGRLVEATFGEVDAGEVEGAVEAFELLDFEERLLGLTKFRAAFEEQADAVIVPALPDGNLGLLRGHWFVDPLDRKGERVAGDRDDGQRVLEGLALLVPAHRQVAVLGGLRDVVHVLLVELAVLELHFDRHMVIELFGHCDAVMGDLPCPGRHLMIVERDADVLRIAAVDTVAVLVEQEDVDEVRPAVDLLLLVHAAAATDHLPVAGDLHIDPDLVGVDRPL